VEGFFSAKDVPHNHEMGAVIHDEVVFAEDVVTAVGQPIGIVVATTVEIARHAVRQVGLGALVR
jgi:xanthine dehydrogenase molybdopterin-binding subunit B